MIFMRFLQIFSLLAVLQLPASAPAQQRPQPEMATGFGPVAGAEAADFMIVTANPYATRAGYEILQQGGSAADAAITAQLVLGLSEPQSSGLGGGAFILHYDAKKQRLTSYDGRETAPGLAGPFLFQHAGKPMAFMDAVVGGRAVGVPGVPALLKALHRRHGVLEWPALFAAPVKLAEDGFTVSPRLAKMVAAAQPRLARFPQTAAYFLPHGRPLRAGDTRKNPAYAATLKRYAASGPPEFYRGKTAFDIVQTVQTVHDNPGLLALHDFGGYAVKQRDPVCGPYRAYVVCSMGEPSSGGLTLLQILGMLKYFTVTDDARGWNIIAQASALAFANRNLYMADPDFVNTPGRALLDPEYLEVLATLIRPDEPLAAAEPVKPAGWDGPLYRQDMALERPGTTHISVVDRDGNIVSMTSSIEGAFGSHVMTGGFLLNNQLTDFAFTPAGEDRKPVANMVEGGKRPRSSMSPTVVFNAGGEPVLVIGSAGGSRIIGYVLAQIVAMIDWNMPLDEAFVMRHTLARGVKVETEDAELAEALTALGNQVELKTLNSGLTAIGIGRNGLAAAADPRREGLALGQ